MAVRIQGLPKERSLQSHILREILRKPMFTVNLRPDACFSGEAPTYGKDVYIYI